MAKRRAGSQTTNLILDHKKSGIDPIYLSANGVRHTVGKLSTRANFALDHISIQGLLAKLWGSKVVGILTCPGQKVIWMWALWRGAEYTIRGKVVASCKSRA